MKLRLNKLSRLYFGLALSFFFVNILFLPAQDERADDPGARQCEFHGHRAGGILPGNNTPAHLLRYARDKHRQNRITRTRGTPVEAADNFWMPLGPFTMNMTGFGAVSGRVTDFAFVPSSQRVYAATSNGGLWYTDDKGNTWGHFKNYLANTIGVEEEIANVDVMSCGAVAVSPDGQQLFVGTGEGSRYAADCQLPFEGYSYEGVGVLVSLDQGKSWQREPSEPDLTGHAFFSLAMDPADAKKKKIIGATTNGIYLRVDDSSSPTKYSWKRQSMGTENNSVSSVVAARKNNQTTFYAARWGDKVYKSNDGTTWNPLGKQFPTTSPITGAAVGRIMLAVQPDNPDVVYALIAGLKELPANEDAGGLFGIYRWDNGGDWQAIKCPQGEGKGPADYKFYDFMGGRGWWQMAFAVDPGNVNRLFAAGTEFFMYQVTNTNGLSCTETRVCDYSSMVHPDIHVLKFQLNANGMPDPDKLWVGSDGGAFFSDNARNNSPVFLPKNTGLPTFLMENFGQHPTEDAILYCGTQDNNGLKYQGSPVWESVAYGDCGNVVVDWNAPETNLMETYIGNAVSYSSDGGKKWTGNPPGAIMNNGINNAYGNPPTALVYAPLVGTPYEPSQPGHSKRVAFGGNKVWLHDNFGDTTNTKIKWKSIADMDVSGPDARIKALTFASYGKIYAGTMDGQVYRLTENRDKTWKKDRLDKLGVPENNGGLPAFHQVPVTDIAIDPNDPNGNSIYITLGGMGDYRRVWRFDGATNKWEQRSGPNPVVWGPRPSKKRLFPALTSPYPVSLASFQGKLYAAAVDEKTHGVFLTASPDGKDWTANPKRLFDYWVTNNPVHLASLEEGAKKILAMTFVGVNGEIFIASSTDGNDWPGPPLVRLFGQTTTNHAVSIASFKGSLYLAYVGTDQNIYLSSSADAKTWSAPVIVKPPGVSETNAPVNLSVFKNQLFLTWNLGSVAYTTCSVDGKNWRSTGVGIMANRDYPAGMVAYDGLLYAFCNGDSITATTSADGIYWPDKGNTEVLVKAPWQSAHQLAPLEFKGKLYLGFIDKTDKGIYLGSTDNRIQPSLPNIQHNTLVVDPQNPGTLYAGNDAGIYYSTDAGQSWMPYSNGLPGVPVNHLKIFPEPGPNGQFVNSLNDSRRFLRAATYGRGMFERSLNKDFNNSGPLLYIRKNEMDRGFYDVPTKAKIYDSPDIKISYPNLTGEYAFGQNASFYNFSILPENKVFVRTAVNEAKLTAQSGQEVIQDGILKYVFRNDGNPTDALRLNAQVHNNGVTWPQSVDFYVLAASTVGDTLPNLPAGYAASLKTALINSRLGDWKLMARKSSAIAAGREQGLPYIEDIDLMAQNLPVGSQVGLLILIDHAGQPFNDKETTVARLCEKNRNATVKIFTPAPPAPFFIESKSHPDKIVDVVQSAGHNGAELTTWNKHGGDNQKFFLESSGDGYFYLKNKNSEKYFDYSSQLLQWDRNGGHHQQYKLVPAGDDYYYIEIRSQPGKCLTVGGHGDKITLANKADDVNQLFKFVR
ncbi:MAG: RICIN domain-containing protein [Lewinellaceae bacterium]|nr:RICIN domain-containing protein [Phaeodactylibacter sp.]MCB9039098.1 RICIN domain-containing protein [Lewinellaceae bacterium]